MILNSNISQSTIQTFKDENFELNKENDDELFFNAFNMQSSEFFKMIMNKIQKIKKNMI